MGGEKEAGWIYEEVWGERRWRGETQETGGGDGLFSALRAMRFGESSPLKLVYLTFVGHFPSLPCLCTAPRSGGVGRRAPKILCTSLHRCTPATRPALTCLILSAVLFTFGGFAPVTLIENTSNSCGTGSRGRRDLAGDEISRVDA